MDARGKPEPLDTGSVATRGEPGAWLIGGGELGDRIREKDWSVTRLGPLDSWPASLRTTANLVVSMAAPAALAWGEPSTLLYNDAYRDLLAAKHPQALGASFDETWLASTPELTLPFRQALGGSAAASEKPLLQMRHGAELRFTHGFTPVRDERGAVAGVLHTATDMTAGAHARGDVALAEVRKEYADRLRDANAELEAFSYSVSHDLRAPLRAIDGFSQALQSDYGSQLDDDARRYLDRVRAATQRMAQLIDDLLSLSRIARMAMTRGPVDLSELAQRILAKLRERDPQRRIETQVAPRLASQGDAHLVKVLLESLLENAWKFTAKDDQARIEVGSERRDGQTVFFVRDNGEGFDMQYAGKLFAPFQRLHSAKDFEGTGIGLAIAHRVVTRHGGRIWAEAAPGSGATFYFTLAEGT